MTPESLVAAFARGMMEACLASSPSQPKKQKRGRAKKQPDPEIGSRRLGQQQPPETQQYDDQEPLPFDGAPIPPVFDAAEFEKMEAVLRNNAAPGTRIPGEGDNQGGARL